MTKALLLCIAVLISLTGCGALLDKAEPLNVRYFTPTLPAADSGGSAPTQTLRLGRIESSAHLRERIAYRVSESEVGYHEGLRWTDEPDSYFRRALSRELFENQHFAHVVAGIAPTLDAELIAFEDLQAQKAARVEARVLVHDGRRVLLERTFRVEAQRKDDSPAGITDALSRGLHECVVQISAEVENALSKAGAPGSGAASHSASVEPPSN